MVIIKKDLILIGGPKIYLVNIEKYNLIKELDPADGIVESICLLNDNYLLTGGRGSIVQWRIIDEDMKVISKKENIHKGCVLDLLNFRDGRIVSGAGDGLIRI